MGSYGDYDGPDEEWVEDEAEDDPEADLLVCPFCGARVYDDTEKCPHCGDWIRPEYPTRTSGSFFLIAIVVLLVIGLLLWIL
jgi:uncharacterized protein (DUF983 family)